MRTETIVVGKRGTIVVPVELRARYHMQEGALLLIEEGPNGLTLRPAVALSTEIYSPDRKAAFLLENAVGARDYQRARKAVRALGVDPDGVPHSRP